MGFNQVSQSQISWAESEQALRCLSGALFDVNEAEAGMIDAVASVSGQDHDAQAVFLQRSEHLSHSCIQFLHLPLQQSLVTLLPLL